MSKPAIRVEELSKLYRLGEIQESYKTFRDTLANFIFFPFRKVGRLLRGQTSLPKNEKNTIWALKDVSFDIKPGEVVGIIGRNGAGKTTLLKILSRITEPSAGRAEIRGRVGALLEVGTGFHPELTGRENVYLNGAILGMKRVEIERKFDEIVAFAEVEKFMDTPVKHYSSGMYVRLAFAVAAHLEPEILVVDEVLAVGDLAFQKKCLGRMQDVGNSGRTVFFVSHNMPAITRLCQRALLFDEGYLIKDGPVKEVVSEYISRSLGASGTAEWMDSATSPGSFGFKLVAVSIIDQTGKPVSSLSIEQSFILKISYHVSIPSLRFRCAVMFYTQGVCAFTTLEPVETVKERSGHYHSIVEVPGNLLAEGEYALGISIFSSRGKKMHYCQVQDVVVFQIYDPITGSSSRGDYAEGFAGVVRPKLNWLMEFVGT